MSDAWRGRREWHLPAAGGGWGTGKGSEVEDGTVRVWWEYWTRVNGTRMEGRRTVHLRRATERGRGR